MINGDRKWLNYLVKQYFFQLKWNKVIIPLIVKIHKEDNSSFYLDFECSLDYINDLVLGNILVASISQEE